MSLREDSSRRRTAGEYGIHAAAKNAGFRKGDIFVDVDGISARTSEMQLIVCIANTKRPSDRIKAVVLRGKERLTLEWPVKQANRD